MDLVAVLGDLVRGGGYDHLIDDLARYLHAVLCHNALGDLFRAVGARLQKDRIRIVIHVVVINGDLFIVEGFVCCGILHADRDVNDLHAGFDIFKRAV